MTSTRRNWHLGQLDALRGLAILNVMMVHALYWDRDHILRLRWWAGNYFAFAGQRGVQLFFLVSAFTLSMSFAQRKQERNPTLNFFIRRILRIGPMLYVATLLTLLDWPSMLGTAWHTALSLLFVAGFVPGAIDSGAVGSWSVATEAAFYLVLPLLFRSLRTAGQALWAVFLSSQIVFWFGPLILARGGSADFWYFKSLAGNAPVFLTGISTFLFWQHFRPDERLGTKDRRLLSAAALVAFTILYLWMLPLNSLHVVSESGALLLLVVSLLLYPWPALVNRYTIALGKLSFSVYLLHFHVGHLLEPAIVRVATHLGVGANMDLLAASRFLFTFLLTLPCAWLTYTYVEKPGIQLGRWIIARHEQRAAKAAPIPPLSSSADVMETQF